jgi:hypothetical protein
LKGLHFFFCACIGTVVSLSPLYAAKNALAQPSPAPIRQEMGGLFVALSDLLPLVINKADFENPKNAKELLSLMKRIEDLSLKMVVSTKKFSDNDPSIPFISEKFANDVTMAIDMWKSGDRIIPRRLMRGVTDYCISCHTRTAKGLHLSEVIQPAKLKRMPLLSQAEYLAATRQFGEALKKYEQVLVHRPLAKIDPLAWDEGVRKMLAIAVRVENQPRLTLELLSSIQDSPDNMLPELRSDIAIWRQAAKEWAQEKRIGSMKSKEKLILAKRLLAEGEAIAKKNQGGALIQYLRASALLHELLGKTKPSAQSQELLWMAAKSADYLSELNLWSVQDTYYEACVRRNQDKSLSRKCYEALEKSIVGSYGVASFAGLPEFAKRQLESLKVVVGK